MVPGVPEHESRVDLIVQQEQVAASGPSPLAVLGHHGLGDRTQRLLADHGSRGVERTVQTEQPRLAEMRLQLLDRRHEAVFRARRHDDALGAGDPGVVVVVPRGHRVDHLVAGVEHAAVGGVQDRPRAAGDQHRLERVSGAPRTGHEIGHALA